MPQQDQPLVSIIVPVYNAQAWLPRCLDSIAGQTFTNFECILVDDGSTDGSGVICDEYIKNDVRFHVIHKENGGASSARNAGLSLAKGNWIGFCDADDKIAPKTFEYAVELQMEHPECFVMWNFTKVESEFQKSEKSKVCYEILTKDEMDMLATELSVYNPVCNKLFEMRIIKEQALLFDEQRGRPECFIGPEDQHFVLQYFACKEEWNIAYIPLALYYYLDDNENSTLHQVVKQKLNPEIDHEENSCDEPVAGYCAALLKEYETRMQIERRPAFQTLEQIYPQGAINKKVSFLRKFSYGVWSAGALKEDLSPAILKESVIVETLAWLEKEEVYTPYYWPFKLRSLILIRTMYTLDNKNSRNFFRLDWLGYYLLGKKWKKL